MVSATRGEPLLDIFWTVPRIWKGQAAFILGGGPGLWWSLECCGGVGGLRRRGRIFAINNAYTIDPWADVLYFNDRKWYDHPNYHRRRLGAYKGKLVVTQCSIASPDRKLYRLRATSKWSLSRHPQMLSGWCGGSRTLNLAYLFGCNPIILLGFNMTRGHWHGGHKVQTPNRVQYEEKFIPAFRAMAPELERDRVTVWNCTEGSALGCFPIRDIMGVLRELPRLKRV